ncbi:unnamed protein product [Strongylus vulgaris]|uniref:Uncharacterized protein n=1 Tax=Strongylus vulgaris TaxID=40348 RepID=A0A3P7IAT5_STRVU|nr:unnamed protein product [Strongylus vulgaris]
MASHDQGKPWQVAETFKKEYGIKDKLAPIFCSTSHAKPSNIIVNTTGREAANNDNEKDSESDSDAPLVVFVGRRSSVALPPNASSKDIEKQRKKEEKKKQKEKKEKEKIDKKEEKEKKKQTKKSEMNEAKENGGLDKFVTSKTPAKGVDKSNANASSPFLTPQKWSEKRFNSAVDRLREAWRKRDEEEFFTAASRAAKLLSGVQIEKIPHECHRYAVRHAYEKIKDAEML